LISEIERGLGNPSLLSLIKISRALELPLAALFEPPEATEVVVIRRDERRTLGVPRENHVIQLVSPLQRSFAMTRTVFPAGYPGSGGPYSRDAEVLYHVLAGAIALQIGDDKYELGQGDSVFFDARRPSIITNPFATVAEVISCIAPPDF
jgi:transcriptional regulator with XRE-family HTH domain